MQEETRSKIKYSIESSKQAIKKGTAKIALEGDPTLQQKISKINTDEIRVLLKELRAQHKELLPFVTKIKAHVSDITESTHVCAIYLLSCHIFDNWISLFLLAEKGKHLAIGNLLRMIKEANSIVNLFAIESFSGEKTNLNTWFNGNIVDQKTCRKRSRQFFDEYLPFSQIDEEKLDAHIYQIESQVSHNAYVSILESISPFTEDFDFDEHTGFHRTLAWLRYAKGSLGSTNIMLKMVYKLVMQEKEDVDKLDEILTRFDSGMNNGIDENTLKSFFKN